jgi:hypothetical protein
LRFSSTSRTDVRDVEICAGLGYHAIDPTVRGRATSGPRVADDLPKAAETIRKSASAGHDHVIMDVTTPHAGSC